MKRALTLTTYDHFLVLLGLILLAIVMWAAFYLVQQPEDGILLLTPADQDKTMAVAPALPSFLTVIRRLEPLFIALSFWVTGVVVLVLKTGAGKARLFYATFSLVSCGALVFWDLSINRLLWAERLFYVSLWFLGPLVVHLHLHFPKTIVDPRPRLFLAAWYGAAPVGGLFSLSERPTWLNNAFHLAILVHLGASLVASVALLLNGHKRPLPFQLERERRLVVGGAAFGVIPLGGLTLLSDALLGRQLIPPSLSLPFLIAIPGAYGYIMVRERIHTQLLRLINRTFCDAQCNYQAVGQKVCQALERVADTATLAKILPDSLRDTMELECSCLVLRHKGAGHTFSPSFSCPHCAIQQTGPLRLDPTSALGRCLQRAQGPVPGDHLREKVAGLTLTPDEERLLACAQNRLWVPLTGRDGLLGVLILGPKRCGDLFDTRDSHLLEVVGRQASVIMQNTFLLLELKQRAVDMERLHQQLLQAREEERKRLARELHDEIIQALVSLNYGLSQLDTGEKEPQGSQVNRLEHQVSQLMMNLRKICSELRPPALDSLGLASALRTRLHELEAAGTLCVELNVRGDEEADLPEEIEVCLFRVFQEALTNVQRHARASQVKAELVIESASVRLSVQDDGCGFWLPTPWSQLMDDGHFGLIGLRERVDAINGQLTLRSAPGQGTCLEVCAPLSPDGALVGT